MRSTTLKRTGLISAVLSALLLTHPAPLGSQAPSALLIRNATLRVFKLRGRLNCSSRADSLGTIERGKLADLLILSADPLADIHNIRRIETVIQPGAVHPRDDFAERPAPPTQH